MLPGNLSQYKRYPVEQQRVKLEGILETEGSNLTKREGLGRERERELERERVSLEHLSVLVMTTNNFFPVTCN